MLARKIPLVLVAFAVVSAFAPLSAAVLKVPKQYGTIQSAIGAAGSGDIVEVAGGVYVEDLVIDHKSGLTLRAKDGAKVIVDAGGAGVPLQITESAYILIERLRLRNSANAAGVLISDFARDVTLVKCRVSGTLRGIEVGDAHDSTIRKCIVQGVTNQAIDLGAGSHAIFVTQNELGDFGVGIRARGALHTIEENVVRGPGGNGIILTGCERTCVIGNDLVGVGLDGIVADITIDCSVVGNAVSSGVAGIRVNGGSVGLLVEKNTIVGAVYGVIAFADGLRLMGNKAKKCTEAGFSLSGDRLLVHRNVAVKSKAHGFDVLTSDSSYLGNVSKLSATAGLFISVTVFPANSFLANDFDSIVYS